ncbi:MAG: DUF1569 domain-containing protein [Holophagaceae bacterium]|nr:DUF1569 domain-containing protein [Holophagaceae bacterium]
MPTLFNPADREALLARLDRLEPASPRQWGTMTPAQAMAHCATPLECATGLRPMRQRLIGKLLAWLVKGAVLGDRPFKHNSPTDKDFVVEDDRDLDAERTRVKELVARFAERGPDLAAQAEHAFFGKLDGEQWGTLAAKHLDHHLRQFGV